MANGNDKLRIKTVSGVFEEEIAFSPEEMHATEVAEALESDLAKGKTDKQVKKARRIFGANEVKSDFKLSFKESLKNQLKGLMALFLMSCSLIMYLFRPSEPTYLVMAIVVALITFFNAFAEFRASIALRIPKKYSSLKANVIRNGELLRIESRGLVPGDIIELSEGMMVPADCRIFDDLAFTVLETQVSGVEHSVAKDGRYIARNGYEAVCANMVYAGSIVATGRASAIVCRIGEDTLFSRIKHGNNDNTPSVLKYIKNLCGFLSIASAIVCFVLLFIGIAAGADITQWFICALAIGASSLCDSMVSLCASSLGFGSKQMALDGMVLKNYNSLQKLAKTTTIMCGKNLAFPPQKIMLTGLYFSGRSYDREKRPDAQAEELLKLLMACSDVRKTTAAERKETRGLAEYVGGPFENAIVDYFTEWNKPIGELREQFIRMDAEYTPSGDISRILALYNGKNTVIVRGSPENLLSRCVGYTLDGADYKISDFTRKKILVALEDYARTSSYIIAVACGETNAETLRDIDVEDRLIFKGFLAFSSSLEPGVAEAVYRCNNAGIETVLNSADAYYTALNSAKSAGIIDDESEIITAEQMRTTDRGLFIANLPYYKLFLNIDDSEWLDIIRLHRENGNTTAATAERINQLRIMKETDVSIVPEDSTDTLRQTADALLRGRGINLIADGILNAKTICRRIRSVALYLPAAIIMMFVASFFTACYNQTPAFRAQDVLFGGMIINLVFAFALAFEPRNFKNLKDSVVLKGIKPNLNDFIYPILFSIGAGIVLFVSSASTMSYTCTLISFSLLLFLYAGSLGGHGGMFATKRFGNKLLYYCGFGSLLILAFLIFTVIGHNWFGYGVPNPTKFGFSMVLSIAYYIVSQVLRYFMSNRAKKPRFKSDRYDYDEGVIGDDNAEYSDDADYDNGQRSFFDFDEDDALDDAQDDEGDIPTIAEDENGVSLDISQNENTEDESSDKEE